MKKRMKQNKGKNKEANNEEDNKRRKEQRGQREKRSRKKEQKIIHGILKPHTPYDTPDRGSWRSYESAVQMRYRTLCLDGCVGQVIHIILHDSLDFQDKCLIIMSHISYL